jgi:dienelactone hydrolase
MKPVSGISLKLLTLVLLTNLFAAAQTGPKFWGELARGPHQIGFKTVAPSGRPDGDELHVWYPAEDQRMPMSFGDYLKLSRDLRGTEPGFQTDLAALQKTLAVAITGKPDGLTPQVGDEILRTPMAAIRDAATAKGSFPLVLWTHRYGTTAAQSVLSEYLASHGFIVVYAAESKAPPMPFELESPADKEKELSRQTQRLRAALKQARALPNARPGRAGVIAWSYAGEAAHALQQAEPEVSVVIGLSTNTVAQWVYRNGSAAQADKMTRPYIVVTEPKAKEVTDAHAALVENSASPFFLIEMPKLKHGTFNALEGIVPAVAGIKEVQPWALAGPDAKLGYETMAQYVRRALAHYLYALPTIDTPFRLWGPNGEVPEKFVDLKQGGKPLPAPAQPRFTPVEFPSTDGLTITADLYPLADRAAPVIVLMHQSGSSRGEYRQIAPRLNELGFNALAVDVRWGNRDMWNGIENLTAERAGTPAIVATGDRTKFRPIQEAVKQDIAAAVDWVRTQGYSGPLLLWGSSITANRVLQVASVDERVAAIIDFSPGEYNRDDPKEMAGVAAKFKVPTLIVCGEDEETLSKPIFDAVAATEKSFFRAPRGRHGSSLLLDDWANWEPVEEFLKRFASGKTQR